MIEVEVKLRSENPERSEAYLVKNGFAKISDLIEKDVYFDTASGEIRGSDRALRIRQITDCVTGKSTAQLNHKGKKCDSTTMTREELEIDISDAETGSCILSALGYHPVKPEVIKHRREYQKDALTICLDQVEGLGSFLELEVLVEQEAERPAAMRQIIELLTLFGYQIEDSITTSYLSMLQGQED